jgi:hypothetical protein
MTFETSGKFLQGRAGDFLVHVESTQRCLNTLATITGAVGMGAVKGEVYPLDGGVAIAPGGVLTGVDAFVLQGPPPANAATTTGSPADPYTVIDDFTGAVLNESVLAAAGYDSTDITAIKTAVSGAKWVADPVKITEQKGGTAAT